MTLPRKVYEGLKFVVQLIPVLVTFVGATFIVLGISEATVNIVLVVLGAVGTALTGVVQICRANHWKIVNEDGTTEDAADDTTPLAINGNVYSE